jgi:hypothetical protein
MKVALPMKAVLLSVPLIDESTSGIATRPPEPFSEFACVFVEMLDVTKKSPPIGRSSPRRTPSRSGSRARGRSGR